MVVDVFIQMKVNFVGQEHLLRNVKETDPAYKVLQKEIEFVPDFSFKASETKIPIFFPNPEKNWGPKRKAAVRKVVEKAEDETEKKVKESE